MANAFCPRWRVHKLRDFAMSAEIAEHLGTLSQLVQLMVRGLPTSWRPCAGRAKRD
jgi:hypothetical protein